MMMYEIEVSSSGGNVFISQEDENSGTQVVCLHPDQIELVCEWLRDSADAIRNANAKETQR